MDDTTAAALGALFLLVGFGVALALLGFWVWAIIDAARYSTEQWQAAGQNKTVWLCVVVGTGLAGCLTFGWIGALLYVLIPRPSLKHAAAAPPSHPGL